MKGFLAALLLVLPMLVAPMAANAYPLIDVYDAGASGLLSPLHVHAGQTVSWTQNLTNEGFDPTSQHVTGYQVLLATLDDDHAPATFTQPEGSSSSYNASWFGLFDGTAKGIASLNSNGLINFSLTAGADDFYFYGSALLACVEKGASTSVPEPGSLALLAAGMIGIVLMRRVVSRQA